MNSPGMRDHGHLLTVTTEGMTHRALVGLVWTFLGTGVRGMMQLVVLTVLARLLTVTDFGAVSAALVIVGLSTTLSSFGIGPAVVQHPNLEIRHLRVAFTLSLLWGVGLLFVTWLTAPLLAGFFRLKELQPILDAMAFLFPLQGMFAVAESLLQRKMRFRMLAGLDAVTSAVGYGATGIVLALLGFGVWAFVGAYLGEAVVRTGVLLVLQPHPMKLLFERRALSELLHFGGGLTLASIGSYVAQQGDNIVVGRWLGAEALGLYGRAYQLMVTPASLIGNVLDKVLFPGMARFQDQPERLCAVYGRALALIALLVLPTSVGLLILAPNIIHVLLGPKWVGVIVPFQILSLSMLFRTSYKISDAMVRATGAVYRRAWRQAAYALLVVAGAWAGHWWGLPGVAAGVAGAITINFILMAQLSLALTGMSWGRFWGAHLPGTALASLVGAELWVVTTVLAHWKLSPVLVLIAAIGTALPTVLVSSRYMPHLLLGRDGHWMLQTLASYLPRNGRPEGMSRALTVEFAGIPGAGKSTLAHRVAQLLRQRGIQAEEVLHPFTTGSRTVGRVRKGSYVVWGALRKPGFAYLSARAIRATRQRTTRDAVKVLHNWLLVSFLLGERGGPGGIRLFDQGICQALWSIGHSAGDAGWAKELRGIDSLIRSPDLVVIVDASPGTAARRLAARPFGWSRMERLPRDDGRPFVKAATLLEDIKGALARISAEHRHIEITTVDNDRDHTLEENAGKLAELIHLLHNAPSLNGYHESPPQYVGVTG